MHDPDPFADTSVDWCVQFAERLLQCSQLVRSGLQQRLRPYELRDIQFFVLWRCGHAGDDGIAQLDLVTALAASPAQISAQVEQLRDRQLLVAHRPAGDRRRQHWRLTARGLVLLEQLIDELQPWTEQLRAASGESGQADPLSALTSFLDGPGVDSRLGGSIGGERRKRGAA